MFLKITDNSIETDGINFGEAVQLLATALLHLMKSAREDLPEQADDIYDSVNQAMGNVLKMYDPENTPNPDMDINRIIVEEDLQLQRSVHELKKTNPRLYKSRKKAFERHKEKHRV